MHKKEIAGSAYYYTTYRNEKGEHKTHYLGKDLSIARRKEQEILRQARGLKPNPYKNMYLTLIALFGLTLVFFTGQMTGFFSFNPASTIEFDVNASWNLSDSIVRVSIGNFSFDLAATSLLTDNKIILDAQALQLNTTGRLYADLIVSNELVYSKYIDIREEALDTSVDADLNETIAENNTIAQPLANDTQIPVTNETQLNQTEIPPTNSTNQTSEKQPKLKNHKKASELNIKIKDKDYIEGLVDIEELDGSINVKSQKAKTKVDIKGLRATADFDIRTTGGVVAIQKLTPGEIEVDNATITLPRERNIKAIGYCADDDFDYNTLKCAHWQVTSIPFADNGDTITFIVEHFSAYSGLSAVTLSGVNLSKYGIGLGTMLNYSDLKLWLRLEKGNGSFWNDSSGNSNFLVGNGTASAAPTYTYEGAVGGAYKFDGIDDYLTNRTTITASGDGISISAWLKINSPNIQNITTGQYHTCALITNGDIYCWGRNDNGMLGDGTTTYRTTPIKNQMTAATKLWGQLYHMCAINSSGTYCWGLNNYGQLGDGTSTLRTSPTKSQMTNPTMIAMGQYQTCAVNTSGMYCWGRNNLGQIGNGTTSSDVANQFPTLNYMTSPIDLTADSHGFCAMNTSGMYCWGLNDYGQVGNGSTGNTAFPTLNYMTAPTTIKSGSTSHTCAVNASGMYCWGRNIRGEIGNGTTSPNEPNEFPTKNQMTAPTMIGAGSQFNCATNGSGMYCWGYGIYGESGDGTQTQRNTPYKNLMTNPTRIAPGYDYSCATNTSGMYCWGSNNFGQMGNGSNASSNEFPTKTTWEILALSQNALNINPNWITTTLTNITTVRSDSTALPNLADQWGNTQWQHLAITKDSTQILVYKNGALTYIVDDSGNANATLTEIGRTSITSFFNGTIDEVMIWNRSLNAIEVNYLYNRTKNFYTQHDLGASIVNSSEPPTNTTVSYSFDWRLFNKSIALLNLPFDLNGSVGTGGNWTTTADYSSFANHGGYNGSAAAMPRWNRTGGYDSKGAYQFDGIDDWLNTSTQSLQTGTNMTFSLWLKINKDDIKNVTTGQFHSCALMWNGDVYCWGENTNGQLGDGTTNSTMPIRSQMTKATQVSSGSLSTHTCAVNTSGMYCWGYNGWGSVGDGTTAVRNTPTKNLMTAATQIAVGNSLTCAVNTSGMYCWGYNAYGTIGNGSTANANEFPTLNHMTAPTLISLDYLHACATNTSGMYCWGYNPYGSLGNGSTGDTAFVTKSLMTAATQIETGGFNTCAVNTTGMYCWGNNAYGQIGNASSANNNEYPTQTHMTSPTTITGGYIHTCAVNSSGMYCWGDNTFGQLGDGTTTLRISPTQIQIAGASDISGGESHTCAINSSSAYCFGLNAGGQIGNGSTTNALSPQITAFEILTLATKAFSTTPDWTGTLISNISRTSTTIKETIHNSRNWQMLTLTKDASSLKAYRNGVKIYDLDNASSVPTIFTTLGRSDANIYYNGTLDQVMLYNRTLTAQQVAEMYADGAGHYNTLINQETQVDDNWTVVVTPIDGNMDGLAYTSNILEVTLGVSLNWTAVYNASGTLVNTTSWVAGGTNISFNATLSFPNAVSTVWAVVWNTVADTGIKLWEGIMTLINGVYSIIFETNTSLGHYVNYSIYANDTSGAETQINGTLFYNYKPTINGINLTKYGIATGTMLNYSDGLVAWYKLEKGNGSFWNDSSGNSNFGAGNGTITATPAHTYEGMTGGAHKFDGIDDHILIATSDKYIPAANRTFSVSLWAKANSISTSVYRNGLVSILQSASGATAYIAFGSTNSVQLYNGADSSTTSFPGAQNIGIWYHITVTYNGTAYDLYLNGARTSNSPLTKAVNAGIAGVNAVIGSFNSKNYPFNGTIDEVMIFNRSLNAAEVNYLYNRTKNVYSNHDLGASTVNTTDEDNDTVSYVFDWRNLGTSIALLNLPFDLNGTGGSQGNWTTTKDYSSFGNNAEYNGSAASMPIWNRTGGYDGKEAYQYDGINKHIIIPHNNSIDFIDGESFTLTGWLKYNFTSRRMWIGKGTGVGRYYCDTGDAGTTLRCFTVGVGATVLPEATGNYKDGNWHFVAFSFNDSGNATIYVDGVEKDRKDATPVGSISNSFNLIVGDYGDARSFPWNGTIDQVVVFNRSLSSQQIQEMYADGAGHYNTLVNQETQVGDNWTVVVTPIDGYEDGAEYTSNGLYVEKGVSLNWTAVYNASGTLVNTTSWVAGGTNISFNATLSFPNAASTVWAVVWQTVSDTGVKLWEGIMTLINGMYSIIFETNTSLGHYVNYSIYANDTSGAEVQINGTLFYNYKPTTNGINLAKYGVTTGTALNYSDLVAWWKLEKGNGTYFNDSSGNSLFGIYSGGLSTAPTFTYEGTIGGAYEFNGMNSTGNYILTSTSSQKYLINSTTKTITVWAKPEALSGTGGNDQVIGAGRAGAANDQQGYIIKTSSADNSIIAQIADETQNYVSLNTSRLTKGNWYHIALVHDYANNMMYLYLNGTLITQNGITGYAPNPTTSWPFVIGRYSGYTQAARFSFNGSIDEVMVYNRTLSTAEVNYLYNRTKNVYSNNDFGASIVNTTDEDNDTVSYVFDWRNLGVSIALLNLPFDLNGTGGSNWNWTTTKDYSSFGNNAEYNGSEEAMPRWNRTGGYDGRGAYQFDGIDDYATMNFQELYNNTKTFSFWFNPAKTATVGLLSIGDTKQDSTPQTYIRTALSGNRVAVYYTQSGGGAGYLVTNSSPTVGSWSYFAVTFNGSVYTTYLNGLDTTVSPVGYDAFNTANNLFIGVGYDGFFNGTIDQVMIFNKSLSSQQIQEMYADGNGHYNTLVNQETSVGDNWTVVVTPVDGYEDGAEYTSNGLYVEKGVSLNWTAAYNASGTLANTTSWIAGGTNISFNATLSFPNAVSTVWAVVWSTVADTGAKLWEGIMTLINGVYSIIFETNTSLGHYVNYSIYANDTSGAETQINGTLFYNYKPTTNGINLTKYGVATGTALNYSDLVAWWKLEKGNGSHFNDSSGNGFFGVQGTAANQPAYTADGITGGAYKFDGVNDDISLGIVPINKSIDVTIVGWINPASTATQSFLGYGAVNDWAYLQLLNSDLVLEDDIDNANALIEALSSNLQTNVWTQFAFIIRVNSTKEIYKNGAFQAAGTGSGKNLSSIGTGTIILGERGDNTQQFNGSIDEVVIFNRTLTAQEILLLYNRTKNVYNQYDLGASTVNTTDEDNDTVSYVFDWRNLGTSIALLNLPFDLNGTGGSQGNWTTTKDYSSYGNNAEYNGSEEAMPIWNRTGGYDGKGAYQFDGIDDWMKFSTGTTGIRTRFDYEWTKTFWFKTGDTKVYTAIIYDSNSGNQQSAQYTFSSKQLNIRTYNGTSFVQGLSTTIASPETWNHIAITYKPNSNMSLYVNGAIANSINYTTNFILVNSSSNYDTRYLGIQQTLSATTLFNGTIDQVIIFNRSLSAQQVQEIYADGVGHYNTLVNQETQVGDNWTVVVTPVDGYEDGAEYTSNGLYVEKGVSLNWTAVYNASGTLVNTTSWVAGGTNISFNATLSFPNAVSTVWVVVWQTVIDTGVRFIEELMTLVNGVYSFIFETNTSLGHYVNYSIYANDTSGAEVYINGTLFYNYKPNVTSADLAATLSNNYTTENLTLTITANDQDSDAYNYTIDWRINGTSMAVLNLPFDLNGTGGSLGNWTTTKDYSSFGNNAEYNGSEEAMPRWNSTGGYDGLGAYKFDAIDDFIKTDLQSYNLSNFTFSFWVNLEQSKSYSAIYEQNGWPLLWFNDARLNYHDNAAADGRGCQYSGGYLTNSVPLNTWVYITIVHTTNPLNVTFYFNGTYEGSCNPQFTTYKAISTSKVGARNLLSAGQFFNGSIDEFMIFNRSLSPDQIQALYSYGYGRIVKNETRKHESWQAAITPNDGYEDGDTFYTANLTIRNYPPGIPILSLANNTNTTDNTPMLNWTATADNDTDPITYILEVSSAADFSITNYTNTSISGTEDTTTTLSDGTYYWRARANDGEANSSWSNYYNITIDTSAPTITPHSPANNTGTQKNVTINYTTSDFTAIANCTLRLDEAYNATIYSNTTTNASIDLGATLNFYLYNLTAARYRYNITCTDILNNLRTTENRHFSVTPTPSFGGATTDLAIVNLSNVTNMVIDHVYSGLINFTASLDLSNGTDINSHVNISHNRISIDTTNAPALNKPAVLTLYNLTFTNPRPVKDGTACSSSVCTEISYSGGTYKFSVTGFSVYSSEETPVVSEEAPAAAGGGGGGSGGSGGSGPGIQEYLTTDKAEITQKLALKEAKEDSITVNNPGTTELRVTARAQNLEGKLTLEEKDFTIPPKSSKTLKLYFISGSKPGIVFGMLEFTTKKTLLSIPVVIEVETEEVLFDAAIDLLPTNKRISAGEKLPTQITLFSMGSPKKVDVLLNYVIKDSKGEIISQESETMAVTGQKSFTKNFFIPSDAKLGNYIIGVEVIYATTVATASQMFSLVAPPETIKIAQKNTQIMVLLAAAAIIAVSGLIVIFRGRKENP